MDQDYPIASEICSDNNIKNNEPSIRKEKATKWSDREISRE